MPMSSATKPIWRRRQRVVGMGDLGRLCASLQSLRRTRLMSRAGAFDAAALYEIEIIGETRAARIAAEPLFDPKGLRMRG